MSLYSAFLDIHQNTDLNQGLLVGFLVRRALGPGDQAIPLQGLQGRARLRGAVVGLQSFGTGLLGLHDADDVFTGLKAQGSLIRAQKM